MWLIVQDVSSITLVGIRDVEKYGLKKGKHSPEFWRRMALQAKEVQPTVKEVIRETEVIIKVRCQYCHKLYDETANSCPHCGASR